jgi:hypothetical protein
MGAKPFLTAAAAAMGFAALCAGTAIAGGDKSAKLGSKDDPGRRVCRSVLPTGSRFSTRVCRTQAEWDKSAEDAEEGGRKMQLGPGYQPERPQSGASAPR